MFTKKKQAEGDLVLLPTAPADIEQVRVRCLALVRKRAAWSAGVGAAKAGGNGRSIAADVILGARVSAAAPLVIGAGCRLEDDCRVGPSAVLGSGPWTSAA